MAARRVVWLLMAASCAQQPAAGDNADAASNSPYWADAAAPVLVTAVGAMEIAPPAQPDPGALARILAKAPNDRTVATNPDGGTMVGSDTGEPGDEMPRSASLPEGDRTPKVEAGPLSIQAQISSPSLERAAREQIYWPLRNCLGPDGKPPPPESITLAFTIRADGSIDPASVSASAEDTRLEPTAECVLREFSGLPFRGPFAARRTSARVIITWPSVD